MVVKRVSSNPTMEDSIIYINNVKQAFLDEPEKYQEFLKILEDFRDNRLDEISTIVMVDELLKDHPNLLLGFYDFFSTQAEKIPPEAIRVIPLAPEAKIIIAPESKKPTLSDALDYLKKIKEAFRDEPEKCQELLKLLKDCRAHRVGLTSVISRVGELMKDHPNLRLGFSVFLPAEAKKTLTPEAEQNTHLDALDFVKKVKEAFHDEPAKFGEFRKLMSDYRVHRLDRASLIAKLEELMKDHQDLLLLDFSVYLPAGVNITIPPEAEQRAAPDNKKRKCAESRAESFMSKLKTRFESIDPHVYESCCEILKMYLEANKPTDEVYQEVVTFLQGNEDLVMELSEFFNGPPSGSASTRDS